VPEIEKEYLPVSTLIGVKMQPTELAAIDELIRHGHYKSRSHFLREAAFNQLRQDGLKQEVRQRILAERPTDRRRRVLNDSAGRSV
jgi:Arc/MetJ-type ribon-helix-helix transcriptional regulator